MRGQKVFNDIIKGNGIGAVKRKGRSTSLLSRRNDCLIARYYYYGYIKNKGYEEILRLLMSEFFVSPATIAFLVQKHTDHLQMLKQKAPTLYFFNNRWPHIKW